MRPVAHRLSALALGTALLAACGGSGDGGDAPEALSGPAAVAVVQAAASKTTAAGSSKVALVSVTDVGGQKVTITADGAYDPVKKLGLITLPLPGSGDSSAAGRVEERIVGDQLFLTTPQQPGVFYRFRIRDLVGTSLGASTDPTSALQSLQAISDVQQIGPDEVRGAAVTHYKGNLDAQKALTKLGGVLGAAGAALTTSGLTTLPFDAYLDGEGRLVKLVTQVDLPAGPATAGKPVSSTTTVELFDFGTAVEVTAPPAASVKDGAPLLKALKAALPQASPGAPAGG